MSSYPPPPSGAPVQPPPAGPPAKLDTAATFERIGQLYTSQFVVLIGAAIVLFVPVALLTGLVYQSGSLVLALLTAVIAVVAQALYGGVVVQAVADLRDGQRDFSIGQLLSMAVPFVGALLLGSIVFGLIVVLGFIALIVPGLLFLTWFCLFAPAIVIERRGAFDAFNRSRELVRGNGWRVFGVVIVTVILTSIVGNVIQRIAYDAVDEGFVGAAIGQFVSGLVTAPVFALAVSVLYFQLRDLREPAPA